MKVKNETKKPLEHLDIRELINYIIYNNNKQGPQLIDSTIYAKNK